VRPLYLGLLAATGVFVLTAVATALAFGADWTITNRFAILGASLGWGASVAIRRHRRA
jgi:hypothetical protein